MHDNCRVAPGEEMGEREGKGETPLKNYQFILGSITSLDGHKDAAAEGFISKPDSLAN